MPQWTIDDNGLPVYIDEAGNPVYPGDEAFASAVDNARAKATDYSAAPDAVSGPTGETPAPVAPDAAVQPSGTQDGSYGYSQSSSTAGFNPEKYAQAAATAKDLGTAYKNEDLYSGAMAGQDAAGINAYTDQQEAAVASPDQLAGAPTELGLNLDIASTKADQAARYRELQTHFADAEFAGQLASDRVVQNAAANYEREVMTYRAMAVKPGRLWANLGKGGRAGALVSVFVSDFLGARGIKSSGADMLNRAIDEDIAAQSAIIDKQGRTVDMFGNLWNQAIAQSATKAEARERMRGFYLEDFKAQVAQELSQYDAPLAQVAAVKAIAQLDQMRQDSLMKNRAYWQERGDVAKNRDLEAYKARLQAAMSREQNASAERIAGMETGAKLAMAGDKTDPLKGIMFNPETGDPEARYLPDITDADKEEQRLSYKGYLGFVRKIKAFKDLQAKYGKLYDGPGGKFIRSTAGQRVYAAWVSMINDYVYSTTGKQVNENEFNRAANLLPLETVLTRSDNQDILNDRINEAYDAQSALTRSTTTELTDADRAFLAGVKGHSAEAGAGIVAETRNAPPEESTVQTAFKAASSKDSQDRITVDADSDLDVRTVKVWDTAGLLERDRVGHIRNKSYPRQWARDMVSAVGEAELEIQRANAANDSDESSRVFSDVGTILKDYQDPNNAVYYPGGQGNLVSKDSEEYQQKSAFAAALLDDFIAGQTPDDEFSDPNAP